MTWSVELYEGECGNIENVTNCGVHGLLKVMWCWCGAGDVNESKTNHTEDETGLRNKLTL